MMVRIAKACCLLFAVLLATQLLFALAQEESCKADADGSGEECSAKPPSEKLHLAGFLPDGYLARAKSRLLDFEHRLSMEVEVKEFKNRKEYNQWSGDFLRNSLPTAKPNSSNIIWLEEPYEYFGDSDVLELYAQKCIQGDMVTCSPRTFVSERTNSLAGKAEKPKKGDLPQQREIPVEDGWEEEGHQALNCKTSAGEVKMIIFRAWNPEAFDAFTATVRSNSFKATVRKFPEESFFQLKLPNAVFVEAGEKTREQVKPSSRGVISTRGSGELRLGWKTNSTQPDDGFVSFGLIPEGDLKRVVSGWISRVVEIHKCEFLPGGKRRVQAVLAVDQLPRN